MDMAPALSDILGLIRKLPNEQRAALHQAVTTGDLKGAREEVVRLAGHIGELPQPVREAIVKGLEEDAR